MSTSTDAYLYFGFDFLDEEDEATEFSTRDFFRDGNWDDEYAKRCGIVDGSNLFNSDGEYAVEVGEERDRRSKVYDAYRDDVNKLTKALPCELDIHCHSDCAVNFICLKDRFIKASRGYPEDIESSFIKKQMAVPPNKSEIDAMKEFCKVMEIPWQEPGWRLASYWG